MNINWQVHCKNFFKWNKKGRTSLKLSPSVLIKDLGYNSDSYIRMQYCPEQLPLEPALKGGKISWFRV